VARRASPPESVSPPTAVPLPGGRDGGPLGLAASLVPSIHAMNRAWKADQERLGPSHETTLIWRALKDELQLCLLMLAEAEDWLAVETSEGQPEIGLQLRPPLLGHPHLGGFRDAAHIPCNAKTAPYLAPLLTRCGVTPPHSEEED
jgi:hypothetical protein